jgi:hypothetical protein
MMTFGHRGLFRDLGAGALPMLVGLPGRLTFIEPDSVGALPDTPLQFAEINHPHLAWPLRQT